MFTRQEHDDDGFAHNAANDLDRYPSMTTTLFTLRRSPKGPFAC